MPLEKGIGRTRGEIVVCITPGAPRGRLERCLHSVDTRTGPEIPILVCGPDPRAAAGLGLGESRTVRAVDLDFAGAAEATSPADMVWLSADQVVADGWLAGLHAAAHSDSRVASATALTNAGHPGAVAVPADRSFDEAAEAIRDGSAQTRPRVSAAGAHCVYIKRSALELAGRCEGLDDFSARCVEAGLCHVLADDVLVADPEAEGLAAGANPDDNALPPGAPLPRALGAARRSLRGLSIAIDARILSRRLDGTRLHVLELIAAVAQAGEHRVRAIVARDLDAEAGKLLSSVPGLEVVAADEATGPGSPRADLVHRPHQVDSPADLAFLAQLGERLLVTQQDLIAYNSPGYFRSPADWQNYRELTRGALASADRVLFFSNHARNDALAEGLVERQRASAVHIGVDHPLTSSARLREEPPEGAGGIPAGAEVMLCLGSDYRHKNRPFALRVVSELQRRHDWRGVLLLAGAHVPFGSSQAEEAQLLGSDSRLRESVSDLGEVSEAEKRWLLARARLVVYPSVYEGFGLVPFEVAAHDVPCLWAAGTSLSEILPEHAARIVPWDAGSTAENALRLMREEPERSQNVAAVRDAGASLLWDRTATLLLEVYRAACQEPPPPVAAVARTKAIMQAGLTEDAVRLVGPDGALPREMERPLLALATHPRLGKPVLGAMKGAYALSQRWRGRRPR